MIAAVAGTAGVEVRSLAELSGAEHETSVASLCSVEIQAEAAIAADGK